MGQKLKRTTEFVLIGGIAYWIPDILIHCVVPEGRTWILMLSFFVPAVATLAWYLLASLPRYTAHKKELALYMLLGVWVFGPIGTAVGAIPAGGTFFAKGNVGMIFYMWAAFPITTFVMSTYSGSLGGIGIISLILAFCASISKNRTALDGMRATGV